MSEQSVPAGLVTHKSASSLIPIPMRSPDAPISYYCPECGVGVTTSRVGHSYLTWEFAQRFWHLSCKAKVAPGGVR